MRFGRFIKAISTKSDLDKICAILKIDVSSDTQKQKKSIIAEVGRLSTNSDEMDAVSEMLKEITDRDF